MGEFLRKYVSRRLLALSEGETQLAQQRCGSSELAAKAEPRLTIFHQLFYDEWAAGSLIEALARIKVDEKNCFGMIEWKGVREAACRFLPEHTSAVAWKHRSLPHVEQEGLSPMPKDRGGGQGDVAGPLECSLALGIVAAETRERVPVQQASGSLLCIGVDDPSGIPRVQAEHTAKLQRVSNYQLGGPEKLSGAGTPRRALQKNGGIADLGAWMMVTSCITRSWCRHTCTNSMEQNETHRNRKSFSTWTTWVRHLLSEALMTCGAWPQRLHGSTTLGVAVGPRQFIVDQLLDQADVIRAMHERVQLCQDPQTEFAFLRESLGVSRKHILRVHGHTIQQERQAAEIFDEAGQRSLERLSRISRWTVWCKPHSAQAYPELVAGEGETSRLQHTSEHS